MTDVDRMAWRNILKVSMTVTAWAMLLGPLGFLWVTLWQWICTEWKTPMPTFDGMIFAVISIVILFLGYHMIMSWHKNEVERIKEKLENTFESL